MKGRGNGHAPDPLEWDFSEVPESEQELCFYYENAREAVATGLFTVLPPPLLEQWRAAEGIAGTYSSRSVWLFAEHFPKLA